MWNTQQSELIPALTTGRSSLEHCPTDGATSTFVQSVQRGLMRLRWMFDFSTVGRVAPEQTGSNVRDSPDETGCISIWLRDNGVSDFRLK
ncbi:hypothetical protein TSAR_004016 [Trichomalopsis sarcophagae]|uniref:Uncharacterized protein n=1 Tax=Trichomalopsis sarcophagae TaxID=543379 RepID=A0A232EXZ1_9HYME|nr:hypothetical protein TSAR_004016 [Trichomalopsis sarcophagae]